MTNDKSEARELRELPEWPPTDGPWEFYWRHSRTGKELKVSTVGLKEYMGSLDDAWLSALGLQRLAPADASSGVLGEATGLPTPEQPRGDHVTTSKTAAEAGETREAHVEAAQGLEGRTEASAIRDRGTASPEGARLDSGARPNTDQPTPEQPAADVAGEECDIDAMRRLARQFAGLSDAKGLLAGYLFDAAEELAALRTQLATATAERDDLLARSIVVDEILAPHKRPGETQQQVLERLDREHAEASATLARVRALVPKWDGEQANYAAEAEGTDTDAETAAYAAACLRCCMRELSAALNPAAPGDGGTNDQG